MSKPGKNELTEVTLGKKHTHAGEKKKPGDKIMVTAQEKEFLERHKILAGQTDQAQAQAAE
ncbi:hypothetical protein N5C56_10080 [Pseudomonas chengduensis]|nr:hypothetical protein [Pseudomonas chengduensis]MDH1281049.1 hypothetical protein [Pseudomonas chengduensis]